MEKKWNGKEYDEKNNIIYEWKNGTGLIKEYSNFSDFLEYEGEYKNGLRNGNGKEYRIGYLIFEGEYLNGLRNGKGKEYDEFGELIFEGEYFKGKMWNWKNDSKNYKISLKKGKRFVKKLKEEDGEIKTVFEAEYLNGELNGKVRDLLEKHIMNLFQYISLSKVNVKIIKKKEKGKNI